MSKQLQQGFSLIIKIIRKFIMRTCSQALSMNRRRRYNAADACMSSIMLYTLKTLEDVEGSLGIKPCLMLMICSWKRSQLMAAARYEMLARDTGTAT